MRDALAACAVAMQARSSGAMECGSSRSLPLWSSKNPPSRKALRLWTKQVSHDFSVIGFEFVQFIKVIGQKGYIIGTLSASSKQ